MSERKKSVDYQNLLEWCVIISITLMRVESIMMVLLLIIQKWKGMSRYFWIALILFLHAFFISLLFDYQIDKSIQQIVLIGLHGVAYYGFIKKRRYNIEKLWGKYYRYCEILAYLGIFQAFCLIVLHLDPFAFVNDGISSNVDQDGELRLHSIFKESGYLASFMVPYIVFSLSNFRRINKIKFVLSFLVFIGTFSSAAYVILFFYFLYRLCISKYRYVGYILIPFLLSSIVAVLGEIGNNSGNKSLSSSSKKVKETLEAISDLNPYALESFNLSTYATLTNFWVALNAPSRVVGTGIGTHEQSYTRLYKSGFRNYGLNKEDAYSLFTRLYSEFGVIGISIFFLFVIKNYNKRNSINIACFFYLMSILIRGGHYTFNGVFLFVMIYFFTSKLKENKYYEKVASN